MNYQVRFTNKSKKQLSKIEPIIQRRIKKWVMDILQGGDPRSQGKALRGNLSQFWRYRIGDYRLICEIEDQIVTITVISIGHRREVYK